MASLLLYKQRFWKNDGSLNAGGKVYVYESGTSTPKTTYTTAAATVEHTHPIVLDAKGEADIFTTGTFKVNVTDSDDVQITGFPVDGLGDVLGSSIHSATAKTTPVDADELPIWDSVALVTKKVTWANIKATLKTYYDTVYYALGGALGTPSSGTLTNCTGLPAGGLTATATDKIFGRSTAGAGVGEEITCTAFARSILDDADEATFKATVNLEPGTDMAALAGSTTQVFNVEAATADDHAVSRVFGDSRYAAIGKHTIYVPAGAMVSRLTNGAASAITESTTNKVLSKTFNFDTATVEYTQFSVQMPKSWNEGTVTFIPVWSHASTTTNFGVVWQLAGVALSNGDAIDTAFGTAQSSTDTGGTTDTVYSGPESSAITIAGTPAAQDWVVFQLSRLVSDGSDTMAIDARLHGIQLLYTTDAGSDA